MFRPSFFLLSVLAKRTLSLAPGDLTVSLKAVSPSVPSVDNITITAIVSNPTASDLRVLAANNILDTSATKSFDIKAADGREVPFAGVMASYDFGHDSLYLTVPAGNSVALNHSISTFYDFSFLAAGTTFSIIPLPLVAAQFKAPWKILLRLTCFFTSLRRRGELDERTSIPICFDGGKRQTIADSLRYARSSAGGAATDIQTYPNGPQYERYFGRNSQPEIWWNLDLVAGDLTSDRNIYCSTDFSSENQFCISNPAVTAFTVMSLDTPIYVCDLFFSAGNMPTVCQNGYDSTHVQ
ncbi:neutral protease 2 [Moniliophthora roreri MCA 2997]|uniref:Neutral protease 2 n=1 Tax=Moniliophthora roreri (strain MCA 2997) TaxID=1381753 RepID=V2WQK0_MONRO|nr:neutral protease 2 [Moniliophthora roreri MCA 2997]